MSNDFPNTIIPIAIGRQVSSAIAFDARYGRVLTTFSCVIAMKRRHTGPPPVKIRIFLAFVSVCSILSLFIASNTPTGKDSICLARRNGILGFAKNTESSTNQIANAPNKTSVCILLSLTNLMVVKVRLSVARWKNKNNFVMVKILIKRLLSIKE